MAQKDSQLLEAESVLAFHLICHRCKATVRYPVSINPQISLDCPVCFGPWLPEGSADRAALENLLKALVPVLRNAEDFLGRLLIEMRLPEPMLPFAGQDVDGSVSAKAHQPKHR
ncbi:MAG: hypothetical protein KGN30_15175 [Nitrospirota bacterium]|nr:hypothetical protein [Nitrospirota bacterium]